MKPLFAGSVTDTGGYDMKRLLVLLITLTMILCLAACGKNANDASQTEEIESSEEAEETEEAGENEEAEEPAEIEEDDVDLNSYTLLYLQSGPLALVYDGNYKIGALDASGKFVIPCKYCLVEYIGRDRYLVGDGESNDKCKFGIVDIEGNEIVPCEYESLGPKEEYGMYYYLKGYKEPEGEFVTARKKGSNADEYVSIVDGRSVAEPEEGKMLTFDSKAVDTSLGEDYYVPVPKKIRKINEEAWGIPYGSNECAYFKAVKAHYYAFMDDNGELGILDADGNELGNGARWDQVGFEYGNGLIAVRKPHTELWALIDNEGNEATDYIFDVILDNA